MKIEVIVEKLPDLIAKACPFCGSTDHSIIAKHIEDRVYTHLRCKHCHVDSAPWVTKHPTDIKAILHVIAIWNARVRTRG
jgi:transcription elongation factor Elf1